MGWGQARDDRQWEVFLQPGQSRSCQGKICGLHMETLRHTAVPSCLQLFAGWVSDWDGVFLTEGKD